MSVEIWPPISSAELKIQEDATQARELAWLLTSLRSTLSSLRGGLEDCAALLTPPPDTDTSGSTLALTTSRNEIVKGYATRAGTRLVRGVVHLKLRTVPPQTLALDPARPVRVPALASLDALLARAVALCLDLDEEQQQQQQQQHERRRKSLSSSSSPPHPEAQYLAARLRLLARHIADAAALVRGPPRPVTPNPGSSPSSTHSSHGQEVGQQNPPVKPDTAWTTSSVSLGHFTPPISRNLSLYVTIQDACLVLYLRALEPADAPVNFGTKLALAIGTTRRLEHDEADKVFNYRCDDESYIEGAEAHETARGKELEVYVREKVRVESADPSLLSLSAKLSALSNTLSLARRNLAAVMGEEVED
ncbi:RAVE subunit 2/Rogdi [Hypoxylon sp. FL1150]|nr:RAVE subunit 2/Rogdi [Hypoxylon sp. FL1150]